MSLLKKWIGRLADDDKAMDALRKAAEKFDDAANEFESTPDEKKAVELRKMGDTLKKEIERAGKSVNPKMNKEAAKAIEGIEEAHKEAMGNIDAVLKEKKEKDEENARQEEDLDGNESKLASVERTRMLLKKLNGDGMAFALALDPAQYNNPVLTLWPGNKEPKALAAALKKALKAKKCTYGMARSANGGLQLTDQGGGVSGLARQAKAYLANNKPMPYDKAIILNDKGEDVTEKKGGKEEEQDFQEEVREVKADLTEKVRFLTKNKALLDATKNLKTLASGKGELATSAKQYLDRIKELESELAAAVKEATARLNKAAKEGTGGGIEPQEEQKRMDLAFGAVQTLVLEVTAWLKKNGGPGGGATLPVDERLQKIEEYKHTVAEAVKAAKAQEKKTLPELNRVQDNGDAEQKSAARVLREDFNRTLKSMLDEFQAFAKQAKGVTTSNILAQFDGIEQGSARITEAEAQLRFLGRKAEMLAKAVVYPE